LAFSSLKQKEDWNLWGLYWRYLFSITLSLVFVAFLSEQLSLLSFVDDFGLLPTIFWSSIALFYISISLIENKGFPYLLFGSRLNLADKSWYRFNVMTISLFVLLAIIGFGVNQIANEEIWAFYKIFGQPLCLVVIPMFNAWFATKRT
jgi:intracellular septation protein A